MDFIFELHMYIHIRIFFVARVHAQLTINHMWCTTRISLSRAQVLPSNTRGARGAPDMYHTNKLVTSTHFTTSIRGALGMHHK